MPVILQIATFFTLIVLLLPNNLLKLFFLILYALLSYLYLVEQERGYLVDMIKKHPGGVNLDELNDENLVEKLRFYTFTTALLMAVFLGILSYSFQIS